MRKTKLTIVLAGALCAGALAPAVVQACARDGVPSVSVNGHLAILNRTTSQAVLTSWSPFVFKQAVAHGRAVALAENNREVARALPRDVFKHPWRWDFGDRSRVGYGTAVHHVYGRAGTYRIAVYAYFASYASWQPFDYVTIHVR